MRHPRITYKTIFNHAAKHWDLKWARCQEVFVKTGALDYNGVTEPFYQDDLESDIEDNCDIVGWSGDFLLAMTIILSYIRTTGKDGLTIYHS